MRNKLQGVKIYTNLHAETDKLYKLIYARGSKNQMIAISQELVKDTQSMIKAFIQRLFPPKPDENPRPAYYYLPDHGFSNVRATLSSRKNYPETIACVSNLLQSDVNN